MPIQNAGRSQMPLGDGRASASLEELLALRHVAPRLTAGTRARASSAGAHLSHLHARGVDYAESRAYQPGDDIRAMDWRVTARSGRAHTKLFREERERSLFVLLDLNPSMRFGTRVRFKSVQALRAAALAAWMTVRSGDRIGALAFGRVQAMTHPRGGPRGALSVLGDLLRWDAALAGEEETLASALQRCHRVAHGGARVLLISDGFSCDEAARGRLLRLRKHVEVLCLCVADALEMAPPPPGQYNFELDGTRLRLGLRARAARDAFQQQLGQGRSALEKLCTSCAVPLRVLGTADDPARALTELLGAGRGGRR